jgi:hypothetical protein
MEDWQEILQKIEQSGVSTPPSTYFKNKKLARPLSKIIINYDKRRPDERTL